MSLPPVPPPGSPSDGYPRPSVTVDIVLFTRRNGQPHVLLIRRRRPPFADHWALPGGFIEMDETLEQSAGRELWEETGLRDVPLEQLYTFGDPGRDPRGRVISVAYVAEIPSEQAAGVAAGDDAADAAWWPLAALPPLAFDHARILERAARWLHARRSDSPLP
ncbi:MAG: NUDIX hydrolase [Caldilineales bacterium]|nr:NUDIX hydrolase [Caldilineales bacterium]MDW8317617.1 NUDIX hydrolase [Anaerolineae bacterium]